MNEIAIHGAPNKRRAWRIALEGPHQSILKHGSKLFGGGCMNEIAIHRTAKKGREWRIALSNHYPWLQTRRWRTHERKRNSWGSEKG